MPRTRKSLGVLSGATLALVGLALELPHCGDQNGSAPDGGQRIDASVDTSVDASVEGASDDASPLASRPPCDAGWSCVVDLTCKSPTTLTGKVFDPAGLNPLANVAVFVPNDPNQLPSISPGTPTCSSPTPIGDYVTVALTDATGSFTLRGVPAAGAVPVTVQIGKWRRTVTVPVSQDCAVNSVADGTLRLPNNRSEGDMPQMALLTGGADNLACFLRWIGVDSSEFVAPGGAGSVTLYRGVGGADLADGGAGDCTGSSCPCGTCPRASTPMTSCSSAARAERIYRPRPHRRCNRCTTGSRAGASCSACTTKTRGLRALPGPLGLRGRGPDRRGKDPRVPLLR